MPNTPSAHGAGSQVQNSSAYQGLVTVGLISYGLIHLLMAWICVQLATGSGGQEASNQGALRELASKPLGGVLLWVVTVGMLALAVWQAIEAAIGHTQFDDTKRLRKRISSVGRTILYLGLAFMAGRIALGGQAQNSNQAPQDASGTLMGMPGGPLLVGALAIAVVAVGVSQVVKGVKRKFVDEDLDGGVPEWAKKLGTMGWIAKGVSLALAGLLIGWAAVTFDPKKAAGLDGALKTLAAAPFGGVLLFLVALGFVAFAVYCFVWSRNARHAKG